MIRLDNDNDNNDRENQMMNKPLQEKIEDYKAKDIMIKHVITLSPTDNLWNAQKTMSKYRIKKIVVSTQDKIVEKCPEGIVTIKDIIKFLIADKTDRDLSEISISEAMTKNLVTANKTIPITDCAKLLITNNVSSLIVLERDYNYKNYSDNILAGIITSTDLVEFFSENCIGVAPVKEYMSSPVFTISIKDKLTSAARLMIEKNVSRLVVVNPDDNNKLVGILSESDLSRTVPVLKSRTMRSVYENIEAMFSSKSRPEFVEADIVKVEDIMTPNPITIEQDADLAESSKIMIKRHISGLPVIKLPNNVNQPVGIISKSDIVKALVPEDLAR